MKKVSLILSILLVCAKELVTAQTYTLNTNLGTITTCSGTFVDQGGAGGDYLDNQTRLVTFCSGTTQFLKVDFSSFFLEEDFDFLEVYDGPTVGSPLIAELTDDLGAISVQSTSTCITFRFTSDGSITESGWLGTISCFTPCSPPIADALVTNQNSPYQLCVNETIDFSGINSTAGVGFNIVDYSWNFDDGSTANGLTSSHSYTSAGNYSAQLIVTDDNGCTNTNLVTIAIQVATKPNFNGTTGDQTVCVGDQVCLNGIFNQTSWTETPVTSIVQTTTLLDGPNVCENITLTFNDFIVGSTLTSAGQIQSVFADIVHSYAGDLTIKLICPSGQQVSFFNSDGTSGTTNIGGEDFGNSGAADGFLYTWTSTGQTMDAWAGANGTASQIAAGTYGSEQPFTNLVGCPLNGDWTLRICDLASFDVGTLFEWGINFDPSINSSIVSNSNVISSDCLGSFWSGSDSISGVYISSTSANCDDICVTPQTLGSFPYIYSINDDFGCIYDTTITITVNGQLPTFNAINPMCINTVFALPTISNEGITGTWSPIFSNSVADTTTYTFTPDAGQCATQTTIDIIIEDAITPDFAPISDICIGDALSPLPTTSINGITGSWSPAIDNTSTTLYTFTPDLGQCAATLDMSIGVVPLTPSTFNVISPICLGQVLSPLPAISNEGFTGVWSPAFDNSQTTTYTFTPDVGQCAGSSSLDITVENQIAPIIICGISTTTSVSFDWQDIAGASDYSLDYTINGLNPVNANSATSFLDVLSLNSGDVVDLTVTPNGTGCFTSATFSCTASNCVPPIITAQPQNSTLCSGSNLSFSITDNGGISYQWQLSTDGGANFSNLTDGGVYSGSSTTTLNITDNTGLSNNLYQVIVNEVNGTCPTTSASAILTETLIESPSITCGTSSTNSVEFLWSALSGATDYSISYTINGGGLVSDNNFVGTNYIISNLSPNDVVDITISANGTGCYTIGTGTCAAIACSNPVFDVQPIASAECVGAPVNFSSNIANATAANSYQWQQSLDGGVTFTNLSEGGLFSGTLSSTLMISDNTTLDGTIYQVIAFESNNSCPTISNTAFLTAIPFATPMVSCGNVSTSSVEFIWDDIAAASSYNFTYLVNGGPAQMFFNQDINSYEITGLSPNDIVEMSVAANVSSCAITGSAICTAINCVSPTINSQPQNSVSCSGSAVNFSITETGGTSYQWQLSTDGGATFSNLTDGGVYSGTSTINLAISDNTGLSAIIYQVIVNEVNGMCSTTSSFATLTETLIDSPSISCGASTINSVEFVWSALTGATDYSISYTINGGGIITDNNYVGTTYTVSSLNPNDVVDIIVSTNGTGCYSSATASCNASACNSPQITTQAQNNSSCVGDLVTFSIVENGASSLQWQVSTDGGLTFSNLADGGVYSGSATTSLSILDNTGLSGNIYQVVLSEPSGTCPVTSSAVNLTVSVYETPSISCGTTTTSSVEFIWNPLTGATDYDLNFLVNNGTTLVENAYATASYTYSNLNQNEIVEMTISVNGSGCYHDTTITCTTNDCIEPVIDLQPSDTTVCEDHLVDFFVQATGSSGFQWQISNDAGFSFVDLTNSAVFSGVTTSTLSVLDNSGLDGSMFRAVALEVNNQCSTISNAITLNVINNPTFSLTSNSPICEGEELTIDVTSVAGATYAWTGPQFSSTDQNLVINSSTTSNSGTYDLELTSNGCVIASSIDVVVNGPVQVNINPVLPLCENENQITLSASIPDGVWRGLGIVDSIIGTFDPQKVNQASANVSYHILSGCGGSDSITIVINSIPTAQFQLLTSEIDPFSPSISLVNSSLNAILYLWDFGDDSTSTDVEPTHLYPFESDDYIIKLLAINQFGCKDSTTLELSVPGVLLYYIPTAFTPNSDEINNTFQPVFTDGYDPTNFRFTVYDRWGQLIFESRDPEIGWDGTLNNHGVISTGSYNWEITFELTGNSDIKTIKGLVHLLK